MTTQKAQDERPGEADAPAPFPPFVRVLAAAYVLSFAVQPIGFLLLAGTGAFLYGLRRQIDGWVLGLVLSGVACVILCSAFRWWFRRWGRKALAACRRTRRK